jgi:hypothetical protein
MSKCYDITLRSILDKHAPLKSKVMTVRTMVPWFNDSLKKLKAKRRKLERIIKSKLECRNLNRNLNVIRMLIVRYAMITVLY